MMAPLKRRLRVAIVDDEALARESLRVALARDPAIELAGIYGDGRRALDGLLADPPDLVLLDVQMPEMDGFELVAELERRRGPRPLPYVVFVTAFDRHAIRAFEVHAVDFLLKPYGDARLRRALERAREKIEAGELQELLVELLRKQHASEPAAEEDLGGGQRLAIKMDGALRMLPLDQILWLEAADHLVRVHTHEGVHALRRPMAELETELEAGRFARVHRRALVNLRHVVSLERGEPGKGELVLSSGDRLPVSRRRWTSLKRRLGA